MEGSTNYSVDNTILAQYTNINLNDPQIASLLHAYTSIMTSSQSFSTSASAQQQNKASPPTVVQPEISAKAKAKSSPKKQGSTFKPKRKTSVNVCETCNKTFERLYNLKVHRRKHNGDKPYPCPMTPCQKEFRWRSSMAHHVKAHHGGSISDIARATKKPSSAPSRTARSGGRTPGANTEKPKEVQGVPLLERNESKALLNNRALDGEKEGELLAPPRESDCVDILSAIIPVDLGGPADFVGSPDQALDHLQLWNINNEGEHPASMNPLAEDKPELCFLAQTDANTTDAEMIWLSQNSNSIRDEPLFQHQNIF